MDYFVFGNVDSRNYNVWIYPSEIDSAPQREYTEVVVAGRNGTLTIDNGRYENIDHVYQGIIFSDNVETDLVNFRNAMVSQIDYQRLEDSIHTDEFYEARFMEIFAPIVGEGRSAVKFEIKFNRKPQRFLKSGESTVPFPANPIEIVSYPFNETTVTRNGITFTDNGDGTITANGTATAVARFYITQMNTRTIELESGTYSITGCPSGGSSSTYRLYFVASNPQTSDAKSDYGSGATITISENQLPIYVYNFQIYVYSGATLNNVVFSPSLGLVSQSISNPTLFNARPLIKVTGYGNLGIGDETITIAGTDASQEIYIDCDIMECYTVSGGVITTANNKVTFTGNDFPVLPSGKSGVSLANTISAVEITPRWYRL